MRHLLPFCLLLTAACGSPFETLPTHHDDPGGDAADDHNVVADDAGHHREAGRVEREAGVEAGSDAPPPPADAGDAGADSPVVVVDAGHDAGHDAPHDAPPPPPVDAGCTPFVAGGPNSCGDKPPVTFCTYYEDTSSYGAPTTPEACRCATTFTCACLYANGVDSSAFCGALGGALPLSCTDSTVFGPMVTCP